MHALRKLVSCPSMTGLADNGFNLCTGGSVTLSCSGMAANAAETLMGGFREITGVHYQALAVCRMCGLSTFVAMTREAGFVADLLLIAHILDDMGGMAVDADWHFVGPFLP